MEGNEWINKGSNFKEVPNSTVIQELSILAQAPKCNPRQDKNKNKNKIKV